MAKSLPVENLLPQNVGSIINYLQLFTEAAQWGAPSCSQPQPATDNGVRDGRSNWLVAPPTLHRAVPPELHVLHTAMRAGLQITRLTALSALRTCDLRNTRPNQRTACAATQGIKFLIIHLQQITKLFIENSCFHRSLSQKY